MWWPGQISLTGVAVRAGGKTARDLRRVSSARCGRPAGGSRWRFSKLPTRVAFGVAVVGFG